MSTEITGLPGHANVSMQKLSKTVATEYSSADKYDLEKPPIEKTISPTQTATQLKGTVDSLADYSVVDNEKVERVKQALLKGTYRINPEHIADKLIALEKAYSK